MRLLSGIILTTGVSYEKTGIIFLRTINTTHGIAISQALFAIRNKVDVSAEHL